MKVVLTGMPAHRAATVALAWRKPGSAPDTAAFTKS
jgi:hypothetical protein